MTVILITGVARVDDHRADVAEMAAFFGEPVELFDPERFSDRPLLGRLFNEIPLLDKAWDVFNLAWWMKLGNGPVIHYHLRRMIAKYQPTKIVAHSLGTVVLATHQHDISGVDVVLMGSPLWMSFFWPFHLMRKLSIKARSILVMYSSRDWIALREIPYKYLSTGNGAQRDADCPHDLREYLKRIQPLV